ncbi:MAG: hypothetical protein LH469_12185 [Frankiaceae bacterium]|nr:hypothetical protein [Frankiaceae bacterium]
MDDLLESTTRCPHCRAAARPGAPWCTLCHADLRPPPPPAPEPEPAPVLVIPPTASYGAPALDPLTEPAAAPGLPAPADADPTWPCATCGARNPLAVNACGACGAGFLAGLREAEGPLLELPGVGDLTRLSRGQRMGLAFGVVLAVVALTALLGLLLG